MKTAFILLLVLIVLFIYFNNITNIVVEENFHRGIHNRHRRRFGRRFINYPMYKSYIIPQRINYNPLIYDYYQNGYIIHLQ